MDKKRIEVEPSFKLYVKKIKKKYKPEKFILFGSRAKGNSNIYSDYDMLIVSKNFEQTHWLDRISTLAKDWNSNKDLHIIPYTPKEFKKKLLQTCIIQQAIKEGIEI